MNVLLIGSGGREHALAWKLAQSPRCDKLICRAGQSGHRAHAELVAIDPSDHRAVIDFCRAHSIGLVVIGPEAPLVDGLADNLRDDGHCGVRPEQGRGAARRIEGLHQGSLRARRTSRPRAMPASRPADGALRRSTISACRW